MLRWPIGSISSCCRRSFLAASCRHRRYVTNQASTSPPPYRILFCGTDTFARTALAALYEAKDLHSSIFVLTAPDAPNKWESKKRVTISPVKQWAQEIGLEHDAVPSEGLAEWDIPNTFTSKDPNNVIVTASFGHLIPPLLLRYFPHSQQINLHPSLLPELSGAAPIQWAIARQMKTTGVSVQGLGDFFDSGNVYMQRKVKIPEASTYASLEPVLAAQGSQLLVDVLRDLPNLATKSWPQSKAPKELVPSNARKLKRSFSEVRWSAWTAGDAEARHRGFGYLYPLTTSLKGSSKIILRDVSVLSSSAMATLPSSTTSLLKKSKPGFAVFSPRTQSLLVRCRTLTGTISSDDTFSILSINKLQSEGKQVKDAAKWVLGYADRRNELGLFEFV